MEIRSIGIDLGKTTFHLIALGSRSQIVIRKKFSRSQLLAYWFLAPQYNDALFRYFQPIFMAELAAMLWLLIIGAKEQPLVSAASS